MKIRSSIWYTVLLTKPDNYQSNLMLLCSYCNFVLVQKNSIKPAPGCITVTSSKYTSLPFFLFTVVILPPFLRAIVIFSMMSTNSVFQI